MIWSSCSCWDAHSPDRPPEWYCKWKWLRTPSWPAAVTYLELEATKGAVQWHVLICFKLSSHCFLMFSLSLVPLEKRVESEEPLDLAPNKTGFLDSRAFFPGRSPNTHIIKRCLKQLGQKNSSKSCHFWFLVPPTAVCEERGHTSLFQGPMCAIGRWSRGIATRCLANLIQLFAVQRPCHGEERKTWRHGGHVVPLLGRDVTITTCLE